MTEARTVEVILTSSGRLDAALSTHVEGLSRSRIAALIDEGAVTLNGERITRRRHKVSEGDVATVVVPPPQPDRAIAEDLPLDIVFEDADLVVVNKAPGMVVHPAPGHASGTLVNALLHHVQGLSGVGGVTRPGIVHRLDRGTSGLMVVAKHDQAHQALAAQFASHHAHREYVAVVYGRPKRMSGTVDTWLGRHPTQRTRMASLREDTPGVRRAVTHYRVVEMARGTSLVACRLETGRTHQIRVHLTELGCPLLGDHQYKRRGCQPSAWMRGLLPESRPMLHAARLHLTHPRSGEEVSFCVRPPEDFGRVCTEAGTDASLAAWLEQPNP